MKTTCFLAYDTLCVIRIKPQKQYNADLLLLEAEKLAKKVESVLSMYNPNTELSVMCRRYIPQKPYPVSEILYAFLVESLAAAKMTAGLFDPTIAPLVKLWNFSAESPRLPSSTEIQLAGERVDYRHVSLLPQEKALVFHRPGIQLDPGAAGKGFALGLVVKLLKAGGVEQAALDFGGNLFVIGGKPLPQHGTATPWKIAVPHPDTPNTVLGTVLLEDGGIATSSWHAHCFVKEGKIYHHLLNPKTGYPQPLALRSVSILSSSALHTDILSTAFFLLGEKKGAALIKKLAPQIGHWIEYIALLENGTVISSCKSWRLVHAHR